MVEKLEGKASCFDSCPFDHICAPHYLNNDRPCIEEAKRIQAVTGAAPAVLPSPIDSPFRGIIFVAKTGQYPLKVMLLKGIIRVVE